jgi:hypothetical protein
MKRNGNKLKTIPDGHPRRMADGKNAFRKMNESQRDAFVIWMVSEGLLETIANLSSDSARWDIGYTGVGPGGQND